MSACASCSAMVATHQVILEETGLGPFGVCKGCFDTMQSQLQGLLSAKRTAYITALLHADPGERRRDLLQFFIDVQDVLSQTEDEPAWNSALIAYEMAINYHKKENDG